jgi:hypothetical protein
MDLIINNLFTSNVPLRKLTIDVIVAFYHTQSHTNYDVRKIQALQNISQIIHKSTIYHLD